MQQSLFESKSKVSPKEDSRYDKWYCIREILNEEYLWDMRCWEKPKHLYTKEEVAVHIQKWVTDDQAGNWTFNCGHCVYCMRKLLDMNWASLDEIAGYIMRNTNVKYPDKINTWRGILWQKEEVEL